MWIEWHIRWRGDERTIRWEDGLLGGDEAAAGAFGRFAVSNAPTTGVPPEQRLSDPALVAAMVAEFADAIVAMTAGVSEYEARRAKNPALSPASPNELRAILCNGFIDTP